MPTDIREPPEGWAGAQLRRLDTQATARLTLSRWPSAAQLWVLEQAGAPVGMIKRAAASTRLRTASEGVACRGMPASPPSGLAPPIHRGGRARAGPLLPPAHTAGRRIARPRGWSPLHAAEPSTARRLEVAASAGGEIGRIAFRGGASAKDSRTQVAFSEQAKDEPLLLVVLLAASAAILLHAEQPRTVGGPHP